MVFFEMQKSERIVLGNCTDEHQKAFFELLGAEAIHFGYGMFASEGIPAGGLFNWKLDTSDGRVYSLDAADYPRLNFSYLPSHLRTHVRQKSTTAG